MEKKEKQQLVPVAFSISALSAKKKPNLNCQSTNPSENEERVKTCEDVPKDEKEGIDISKYNL